MTAISPLYGVSRRCWATTSPLCRRSSVSASIGHLGSADAIYQTINIIEDVQPDIVVIVGADHVYRMDFQQMVQQHIESGAEFTVAGIRQPISQSNQFGVIEVDPDHPNMIKSFQEKPQNHHGTAGRPEFHPGFHGQLCGQHRCLVRGAFVG